MNTKIMEGLAGAGTNMRLTDTTMRVFREARRRGDIGAMERAMDYTGDFTEKAGEYQEKAQEGMKEEAKEVREKAKIQMEEAIQKRKEEQKKLEDAAGTAPKTDTAEVSEEGKILLQEALEARAGESGGEQQAQAEGAGSVKEPVTYNKNGVASPMGQLAGLTVKM